MAISNNHEFKDKVNSLAIMAAMSDKPIINGAAVVMLLALCAEVRAKGLEAAAKPLIAELKAGKGDDWADIQLLNEKLAGLVGLRD